MLIDSGERVIPEKMKITNGLLIEHLARYHFASNYVKSSVLDFACGSGYGCHIIAKLCKKHINKIVGLDNDKQAIEYANKTYYHPLSSYVIGDVTDSSISDKLGRFDYILSFETIEHVRQENKFLSNVYKLLNQGEY